MKTYRLEFGDEWIEVTVSGDGGTVTSNLKVDPDDVVGGELFDNDREFNAAVDGVESLLLSLACNGVDLNDRRVKDATNDALQAIGNNHG